MGERAIAITREDFAEAVVKAQERWESIGKDAKKDLGVKDDGLSDLMMGVQNALFGSLIADVLFDKEN